MNRFAKAWLALAGRLEPETVIADGAAVVTVYRVVIFGMSGIWAYEEARRYYRTCAEAHAAWPGCEVATEDVLKVDGKLYRLPGGAMREVILQPKPKVAKGKRPK